MVRSEYKGSYLEWYATTGVSWRRFLGKKGLADVIVQNPARSQTLDLIERRVKAAKKAKSKHIILPSGIKRKMPV